jgi:FkbM family methyltransferase
VYYEVNLTEGIDLSLYLFGNFQNHVTRQKYFSIPESAVIIDVGANIGSMAFRFAQLATNGHVYAFEPTDYAFNKLLRNISLNPVFSERITPVQLFLSDQTESDHQINAYSSWKVDGTDVESHPLHGGSTKAAESIPAVTLDDFCSENKIQKVDLIKIDTDGHELRVLAGAAKTIEKFRPHVIFETGLYVLEERGEIFEQYFLYFSSFKYNLKNSKNGKKITPENFHRQIPLRSTTDIIAVPLKGIC